MSMLWMFQRVVIMAVLIVLLFATFAIAARFSKKDGE